MSLIRKQGSGTGDVMALPCIYRFPVTEQINGSESSSLRAPAAVRTGAWVGRAPQGTRCSRTAGDKAGTQGPSHVKSPERRAEEGKRGHHPVLDRVSTEGAHRAATCLYSSATQKQQHGNHVCDLKACATNGKSKV